MTFVQFRIFVCTCLSNNLFQTFLLWWAKLSLCFYKYPINKQKINYAPAVDEKLCHQALVKKSKTILNISILSGWLV
jgi:hypothetical protein